MLKENEIYLGDCYDLIKEIEDKSVDLVYIDIPYLYKKVGKSNSKLGKRIDKIQLTEINEITKGIDYSIFDEICRVLKHIYIYGAVKSKY